MGWTSGCLGVWERGLGIQVWLGKHGVTKSAWHAKVFGVRMQHGIRESAWDTELSRKDIDIDYRSGL